MANVQRVSFRRFHPAQVFTALDAINRERFGGIFEVTSHDGGCTISHMLTGEMTFWFEKRTVSWKHRGGGIDWWVMCFFASRMIRSIDASRKIKDEGIDEPMAPDFDVTYPTPDEWFAEWLTTVPRPTLDEVLEEIRARFPVVLWARV